jgi:serine/threonine protein kinase
MHFDVDQRYSLIDVVGRGAYGVVCAARDEQVSTAVEELAFLAGSN